MPSGDGGEMGFPYRFQGRNEEDKSRSVIKCLLIGKEKKNDVVGLFLVSRFLRLAFDHGGPSARIVCLASLGSSFQSSPAHNGQRGHLGLGSWLGQPLGGHGRCD